MWEADKSAHVKYLAQDLTCIKFPLLSLILSNKLIEKNSHIHYLWLYNKLPQNLVPKKKKKRSMYELTASVSQESKHGSVQYICLKMSHRLQTSYWLVSHLKAQLRNDPLSKSLRCWLSGTSSSQATGLRDSVPHQLATRNLPQLLTTWPVPLSRQLLTWQLGSTRASKQNKRGHTWQKLHSLCNLISEVAAYTFAIFYLSKMSL